MTREEAIRILDPNTRRETMKEIPVHSRIEADQEACKLAVYALRELDAKEKLKPMNEWISVNDKLPEVPQGYEQIQVIVWRENGLYTAWFQADNREFYDMPGWLGSEINDITHWMPRPEPPKEEV